MKVCFIGKKQPQSSCRQLIKAFKKVFPSILDICMSELTIPNSPGLQKIIEYNPNFVFLIKGQPIHPDNIDILSNFNIVYFFLDGLIPTRGQIERFLYIAKKSKLVLTPSHQAVSIFKQVNYYSYEFYQAVNYCQMYKASYLSPSQRPFDVFFAGSPTPDRYSFLQKLQFLKQQYKIDIFGSQGNWIPLKELGKTASKYKIIINLFWDRSYDYVSLRNFDMVGSYNFLLSYRGKNLTEIFFENKHAAYFTTPEEMENKIKYFLKNPEQMDKIAQEGYLHCINNHNWETRMTQLIEYLKIRGII